MSKKPAPFRMNPIARAAHALAVLASMAVPGLALAEGQLQFPDAPLISVGGGTTIKITTTTNTLTETKILSGGVKPNIILSIDDSGSMFLACDAKCTTGTKCNTNTITNTTPYTDQSTGKKTVCKPGYQPRIDALRDALNSTFGSPGGDQYRGRFRLAFQGYWNNLGFGPNRFFKPTYGGQYINNSLRVFDSTQQTNFLNWVSTLTGYGVTTSGVPRTSLTQTLGAYSTPSHLAVVYAGEYLRNKWLSSSNSYTGNTTRLSFSSIQSLNSNSDSENPWKATPGTVDPNPALACRRSYHILLSDGMWNLQQSSAGAVYMPYISQIDTSANPRYDGTSHDLPDSAGTGIAKYPVDGSPSGASLVPIYYDNYPSSPTTLNSTSTSSSTSSSSLAAFALYYWSNNLSGDTTYKVTPKFAVPGDEIVAYGTKSYKYTSYWNPKNDPATWQHMQTYTIGFGTQDSTLYNTANDNTNGGGMGAGVISGNSGLPDFPTTTTDPFFNSDFYKRFASGYTLWPEPQNAANSPDQNVPANLYDLVHAAYNGRGKFYPATTANTLQTIFNEILQTATSQSITDTSTPVDSTIEEPPQTTSSSTGGIASAAGSSTQLAGGMAYTAGYNYKADQTNNNLGGWIGSVTGYSYSYNSGNLTGKLEWTKGPLIPAPRNVFTAGSGGTGVVFNAANTSLNTTTINAVRALPLGDIVNSQLVVVNKPALRSLNPGYIKFAQAVNAFNGSDPNKYREVMVYVGANDGMMHAFNTGNGMPNTVTHGNPGTGAEQFAYVPRGLLGSLGEFGPTYKHRYWVDGGIFSGDAQLCSGCYGIGTDSGTYGSSIAAAHKNWATVLVGALGAGGKGYFVLDVTKPTAINETVTPLPVLTDTTDLSSTGPLALQNVTNGPTGVAPVPPVKAENVIGYQFGQPVMDQYNLTMQSAQIVQLNTNADPAEWAVIMGNGYNNASGLPVLLIQSLSQKTSTGALKLYTVAASCYPTSADCAGAGNGLGQPRAVDVDGNGTVDIVYAGDLMGNLWKFDLSDPEDRGNWKATNIFQAVGPTGKAQPITSAPVVVPHTKGGFMVGFGTGKNLTQADTQDAPTTDNAPLNSFYVLHDNQLMNVSTVGSVSVSKVTLEGPAPSFCTAAAASARYSCLYKRTSAPLAKTADPKLDWIDSDKPSLDPNDPNAVKIGGTDGKSGWYFDIPEAGIDNNGNTAKVLANPMMMPGNIVVFFADNVASGQSVGNGGPTTTTKEPQPDVVTYSPDQATYDTYAAIAAGTGTPAANSAESCNEQKATKTTKSTIKTTETKTEPGTTIAPPLRSINYFNLMNSSLPDTITITIGSEKYVFVNKEGSASGNNVKGPGNRFRVTGTDATPLVRDGGDGLQCVGVQCSIQTGDTLPAGRRTGWRFGL